MNKHYNTIVLRLWVMIFLSVLSLGGCSKDEKRASLEAYIQSVKQRPAGEIEPLPQIKPYESYTYQAAELRSPFVPPEPEQVVTPALVDNGIRPDTNRRRELLESFPIDALRMVGTLEQHGKRWALIVDTEGALHRITEGNYVGMNHGKIKKITEEKLLITEIIPSPTGGWQERQSEMALITE